MILNKLSWLLMAIFLAAIGVATPIETAVPESQAAAPATATPMQNPYPTAKGGPLDPSPEITLTALVDGPETYTITLSNSAGRPLSTAHYVNKPGPSNPKEVFPPLLENPQPGTFPAGGNHVLHVPRGWAGNVAISEERGGFPGAWVSLIEGSFRNQTSKDKPKGEWVWGIDVSYVAGYTVPIMCYCGSAASGNRLSGCPVPLFANSTCPAKDFDSAGRFCKNPLKDAPDDVQEAAAFFKPCQNLAYAFPGDHKALANGLCQTQSTTCVILPDNGPH
ncbi:hypothetical protein V8F20_011036 [Naviculisporaceae sp. PSN 640]